MAEILPPASSKSAASSRPRKVRRKTNKKSDKFAGGQTGSVDASAGVGASGSASVGTSKAPAKPKAPSRPKAAPKSPTVTKALEGVTGKPSKPKASKAKKPGKLGGGKTVKVTAKAGVGASGTANVKKSSAVDQIVNFALNRPGKLPGTGGRAPLGTVAATPTPSTGKVYVGAGAAAANIVRATAEDPIGVSKATAKSVPLIARGIAGAGVELVTHPEAFIKSLPQTVRDDYVRRYGDVLDNPKAFRERLKKDGILPEILDVSSLGVPTVSVVGRGVTKLAETGAAGSRAKTFVDAPRPDLRLGAGPKEVVKQDKSRNAARLAAQRAKDARRAKVAADRKATGKMRGLVPEAGEVVKGSLRAQNRAQRRIVARTSARTQARVVRDIDREVRGKTGVVGNVKKLTRPEQDALTLITRIGLPTDPVRGVAALKAWRAKILKERAARGTEVTAADNIALIDAMIANPERYFTPAVRKAADAEVARGKRVAAINPALGEEGAVGRQFADQAAVVGVKRGGVPVQVAVRKAGKDARSARAEVRAKRRAVVREEYKAGKTAGRAEVIVGQSDRAAAAAIAKAERAARIATKSAENYERRAAGVKAGVRTDLTIKKRGVDPKTMKPSADHAYWVMDRSGKVVSTHPNMQSAARAVTVRGDAPAGAAVKLPAVRKAELLASAKAARERAAKAKERAAAIRATVNRKPVATNARAERAGGRALEAQVRLRAAESDVAKADARVAELKAAKKQGTELIDAEPHARYVGRVQKAAARRGLVEPGYVFTREFDRGGAGAYAGGNVSKAVQADKRYRGDLFATGRADTSIETLQLGVARGIKRAHNWHGVADTLERNAPAWGRNQGVQELEREIRRRGLDPNDWAFVDTGKFREALDDADLALVRDGRAAESASASAALRNNTMDLDGALSRYKGTGMRLTAVPRVVAQELDELTRPGGSFVRGVQKFQGVQSKILLHTNPTFVPIQVLSNTPLAMLALRGNIKALLDGQRWYRQLDQQTRDVVDEYIGASASQSFGAAPRFGEAADSGLTRFYESVATNQRLMGFREGKGNPLNWNPLLDAKQNAFFRRAVFYDAARRSAKQRMQDASRGIIHDAEPVMAALKMPPGPARDAALRRAEPEAERIADNVNRLLGDYTTFTAKERKYLKTTVLFYGFMRWATQLAFYTLPIKHPVATSIAGKLGQLHNEEVISLLSDEAAAMGIGDPGQVEAMLRRGDMPYVFGRVWFTKDGNLEYVDATRLNPLLGPLMESAEAVAKKGVIGGGFKGVLSLPSPAVSAGLDAAYGKSSFTGQDLVDQEGNPLGPSERFFAGQMLNTAFPIRVADQVLNPGTRSDDSLPLIDPRFKPATGEAAAGREEQKKQERGSDANVLLDNLLPIARSKRDGTMRGIARVADEETKRKVKRGKAKGGSAPTGVLTQKDIDAMTATPLDAGGTTLSQEQIDAMTGGK